MNNDLISREALKKAFQIEELYWGKRIIDLIDNAPSVETDIEVVAKNAYKQGYTDGWKERFGEPEERPQGEWGKYGECPFCTYIRQWKDDKFCGNCGAKLGKGGAE